MSRRGREPFFFFFFLFLVLFFFEFLPGSYFVACDENVVAVFF